MARPVSRHSGRPLHQAAEPLFRECCFCGQVAKTRGGRPLKSKPAGRPRDLQPWRVARLKDRLSENPFAFAQQKDFSLKGRSAGPSRLGSGLGKTAARLKNLGLRSQAILAQTGGQPGRADSGVAGRPPSEMPTLFSLCNAVWMGGGGVTAHVPG